MSEIVDKNLMFNIINSNEFKGWLTSRRWFGDKSALSNLEFEISFLYFEIIAKKILLCVIQIQKENFTKAYFLPLILYRKLDEILEANEKKSANIIKLTENTFSKKIIFRENVDKIFTLNLVEAEYCVFFWKNILFEKNITEQFPKLSLDLSLYTEQFEDEPNMVKVQNLIEASLYPERYDISIEQLGKGNTTNLLFKLSLFNKMNAKKPTLIYVLKSYKEYAESLEPATLYVLVKNIFPNAPKIYGTIKIMNKETIGILEYVPNLGNLGDIYWSELNEMINNVFNNTGKNYASINNKDEFSKLINTYCPESIKISVEICDNIKALHKALILPGKKEYESEKVGSEQYLKSYTEKLNNMISYLQKLIKQEAEKAYYNLPKISSILIDIKDIIEDLRVKYQEKFIIIQPVHQDLHMEQILYNKVNGNYTFYFIDFEGDPQLTLAEKKEKFSIEKDLAAFTRALSYIKFNTLLLYIDKNIVRKDKYEVPEEILYNLFFRRVSNPVHELLNVILNLLNAWELKLINKFLKNTMLHYSLITYFYIERTLHEVTYEFLFRPNKIIVPLLGLKEIVERN
jgi:hypothetical protein